MMVAFMMLFCQVSVVTAQISQVMTLPNGTEVTDPLTSDARLHELITKLQTTVYLRGGEVKVKNQIPNAEKDVRPIMVRTDMASIEVVGNPSFPTAAVELVVIRLDDVSQLKRTIDMSVLQNYAGLKYVQLKAPFKCDVESLKKMLINLGDTYSVLYTVEVPS